MAARFADPMKVLAAGMTPAQAIRNIESREAHLAGLEVLGAKARLAEDAT